MMVTMGTRLAGLRSVVSATVQAPTIIEAFVKHAFRERVPSFQSGTVQKESSARYDINLTNKTAARLLDHAAC
jgi:hypothetical protein